jgi:hypothetical protein
MTTQNTIQFAGAAEAIDQLIAIAQATREAYYATMSGADFGLWDRAEQSLKEAVAAHLDFIIDDKVSTAPVAWVHRCEQIAFLTGLTETQVNDAIAGSTLTGWSANDVRTINSRTNARLARWVTETYGYLSPR